MVGYLGTLASDVATGSPWAIIGFLFTAIGSMAIYVSKLSNERVMREREINSEYQKQRDQAVAALAAERTQREDKLLDTMNEVIRAQSAIEKNIATLARATSPRHRPEMKAEQR